MAVKLYLGVEGVLLHRTARGSGSRRGFVVPPYALEFLSWAIEGFECYWLTSLDQRGGDNRIRRAFRIALELPARTGDFDILFECVNPTVWDRCMAEAIDLDSDFYWITKNPDQGSLAVLERRGLNERMILCSTDENSDDFAKIQVRLESLYEYSMHGLDTDSALWTE